MGGLPAPHAERLYAAALIPETTGAHALLVKIKGGKLCDGDGCCGSRSHPAGSRQSWAGLNSVDSVRKAAELLADYGWLARGDRLHGIGRRQAQRALPDPSGAAGREQSMSTWLARLKIRSTPETGATKPTKPTQDTPKGGFVGFVAYPQGIFRNSTGLW